MKVGMPIYHDAYLDNQTTSTIVVLFDNVRRPLSTPEFSLDSNMSRVSAQTESPLITNSSSVQDRCSRHHARRSFLWFIFKGMQTRGCLAYRPPALTLWVTVIREMSVRIVLYRWRDSRIVLTNLSPLDRSLK
ncbi:hypothetical protein TNCV_2869111 [Trichonephila clavipes]|nr:hypothetical protein TNCV_2869111 [Trichonephila clavipes]